MQQYKFDERDIFYENERTNVKLFKGICTSRNNLKVVLKLHSFSFSQTDYEERISQTINAAVAQARVQHPHTCDILDVQFQTVNGKFLVYHVLEFLETSFEKEIAKRLRENRPCTETELRDFLQQISSAVAYARSKVSST